MIMLASCVQSELSSDIEANSSFKASIQAPSDEVEVPFNLASTRTFIDERDVYESGVGTLWRKKEVIGVYGGNSKNVKFTSTNTSNSGTVSFSGLFLGTPQYAYYPYSESNKNVPATAVKGNVPALQEYNSTLKDITGDYRAGVFDDRNWFSSTFTFKRLVSLLKFSINATGTALEGSQIRQIDFVVSNKSKISGNFTINLHTQTITNGNFADGDDRVTLKWVNEPSLLSGSTQNAYMTCIPAVKPGDEMTFVITTNTHRVTIKRTSKVAFAANGLYYFPLTLTNFPDMIVEELVTPGPPDPETPATGVHPVLKSMKFTVADNPGKILGRKLVYQSSATTFTTRTEEVCTVDTTNHMVSLYLPYLNNRKLVPVFEIPEGTTLMCEDGEIISGETEVDFTTNRQIAVVNEVGDAAVYDINFTNTGLPVVVVNQKSGVVTSNSGEYKGGSAAWYKATGTAWQPKESDWLMTEGDDNFMVYYPDGTSAVTDKNGATVTNPLLASTRVRGNVSQKMPKKPFAVKLDKKSGIFMNDADNTNDLPAHKRWVLLANWSDRTLMRNAVAFDIAEIFQNTFKNEKYSDGTSAAGTLWNPDGQFVELVYNGVHVGNYYLCEQIKIDGNRLDIEEPMDAKDNPFTGDPSVFGYLLECDDAYNETVKFITKTYIPFQFKDDADAGGKMLDYAKGIVNGIDDNLYNGKWSEAFKTMDLASFVDFLLIQELTMNGELAHPKSCYTYINNGKLYAGPVWDFDWQTFPNVSVIEQYYDNAYTGGRNTYNYTYTKSMLADGTFSRSSSNPSAVKTNDKGYMWYPMLVKSAEFKTLAAERWNKVKDQIALYADTQIPAMAAKIKKSEAENWSMWYLESGSRAGQNRWSTYDVGGGFKGDEAMTFDNAVSTLSSTINTRISGMSYVSNQNWPSVSGTPSYSGSSSSGSNGSGSGWWPW